MSQNSVLDFLKKNKDKWYDIVEISQNIEISCPSTNTNLRKLRRHGLVDYRAIRTRFYYKYK